MSRTVGQKSHAFPNAYVDVDEPPNRTSREKFLALVGMFGAAYFGLTILVLHFEPTGYDPLRQAVSDYGVGRFAVEMQLGFFAGGISLVSLALAFALADEGRVLKLGSLLLLIGGVALFIAGGFPTDIAGAAATLHGTIHSSLSLVVFTSAPIGMLLVSYGNGRRWFWTTMSALAAAGGFFAATLILSLDAGGVAERLFILVLLLWWFAASWRQFRTSG